MNDLLPCPFCGGHAAVRVNGDWTKSIWCLTCRAICGGGTLEYVTDLWNRRALPAASQPEAEPVIMQGMSDDTTGLARFGHHPDPAIDFCVEVETLESRLHQAEHGLSKPGTEPETVAAVLVDIQRAMDFRVGGDEGAVNAKHVLRELEARATPAPVVPAEGLADYDSGLLNDFGGGDVGWWQDYLRAEIGRANEFWREQVENSALRAQQPAAPVSGVTVKPLVWEDQPCGSYCWVQGLHYYTEGSDEDRDWYVSCMIDGSDVWQGENQPTRGECKALAQADYEQRILSALEGK